GFPCRERLRPRDGFKGIAAGADYSRYGNPLGLVFGLALKPYSGEIDFGQSDGCKLMLVSEPAHGRVRTDGPNSAVFTATLRCRRRHFGNRNSNTSTVEKP